MRMVQSGEGLGNAGGSRVVVKHTFLEITDLITDEKLRRSCSDPVLYDHKKDGSPLQRPISKPFSRDEDPEFDVLGLTDDEDDDCYRDLMSQSLRKTSQEPPAEANGSFGPGARETGNGGTPSNSATSLNINTGLAAAIPFERPVVSARFSTLPGVEDHVADQGARLIPPNNSSFAPLQEHQQQQQQQHLPPELIRNQRQPSKPLLPPQKRLQQEPTGPQSQRPHPQPQPQLSQLSHQQQQQQEWRQPGPLEDQVPKLWQEGPELMQQEPEQEPDHHHDHPFSCTANRSEGSSAGGSGAMPSSSMLTDPHPGDSSPFVTRPIPAGSSSQKKKKKNKSEATRAGPQKFTMEPAPTPDASTLILRNIPNNYNRDMVLELLNKEGFRGSYDFLYLPIDFNSSASLGYAFVNVSSALLVPDFWKHFDGFRRWSLPSRKVCKVGWAGPHQGLEAHVNRYRNSPVMHESVPDEYKPVLFRDGVRVEFPPPTKFPRQPRVRQREEKAGANGAVPSAVGMVNGGSSSSKTFGKPPSAQGQAQGHTFSSSSSSVRNSSKTGVGSTGAKQNGQRPHVVGAVHVPGAGAVGGYPATATAATTTTTTPAAANATAVVGAGEGATSSGSTDPALPPAPRSAGRRIQNRRINNRQRDNSTDAGHLQRDSSHSQ